MVFRPGFSRGSLLPSQSLPLSAGSRRDLGDLSIPYPLHTGGGLENDASFVKDTVELFLYLVNDGTAMRIQYDQ